MVRGFVLAGLAAALVAPAALADKPRGRLQAYTEDTSEVRDLNRRPSKVKQFTESEEQPADFEFPWKQVLGALLCFAIAAPFAWRLFNNVTGEIAAAKDNQQPVRVRRKLTGERPGTEG